MPCLPLLLPLLLLALSALALPSPPRPPLLKERVLPPRTWHPLSRAPPAHTLRLRLALAQPRMQDLHSQLLERSDPAHPHYGRWMSKAEVEALAAPAPESVDAVEEWLAAAGVDLRGAERSPAGDALTLTLPVALAEALLSTEYHLFAHRTTGEHIVRTTEYSLPRSVHAHIRSVQPTTLFSRPRALRSPLHALQPTAFHALDQAAGALSEASSCKSLVTPACLQSLYATAGYAASANATALGITGYLEQYANAEDLQEFYRGYAESAVGSSFQTVLINGGQNTQTASAAGTEANLDTQYAGALTYPVPNTFYSTGGSPPFTPDDAESSNTNEPYADWLAYVLALDELPAVVSTSYGDDEQTVPESYAQTVCDQFAQLGARGVSVIFASGDFGVGPSASECYSNDGANRAMFIPNFPASCPFVTTVGATTSSGPEVAAGFSGGGFSNYFPQPSYQASAVASFLSTLGSEYTGLYNASGRAYPDVSAQGENFLIYVGGYPGSVDGTSCSAPTFASIITLLNDALVRAGKPTLGFLNPFLYGAGLAGLTDITSGSNAGCGTKGFQAGEGWDPVTGLGTPVFTTLRALAGA
ncbi:subtilisin-like protein [Calocera cornea HHB12733]|uniref:tripeptidyl-peptidase II n=1 Tax=Calocera cornea HHB12733 TaxID=1353952 RepID=A0A165GUN3_9BASI|nr:subtilisin-like protein [Calocera cornea HHB12733]